MQHTRSHWSEVDRVPDITVILCVRTNFWILYWRRTSAVASAGGSSRKLVRLLNRTLLSVFAVGRSCMSTSESVAWGVSPSGTDPNPTEDVDGVSFEELCTESKSIFIGVAYCLSAIALSRHCIICSQLMDLLRMVYGARLQLLSTKGSLVAPVVKSTSHRNLDGSSLSSNKRNTTCVRYPSSSACSMARKPSAEKAQGWPSRGYRSTLRSVCKCDSDVK